MSQSEAKFVVGDTLVTVILRENGYVKATDGNESWVPTLDQLEEHYTPVDELADRFVELAKSRRRKSDRYDME